jgi:hypothetical protein
VETWRWKVLIKLVEVFKNGSYNDDGSIKPRYSLRETYINPNHVVCMREEGDLNIGDSESAIISELDPKQEFTKIHINRGQTGLDITVVGSLSVVQEKMVVQRKELLKG